MVVQAARPSELPDPRRLRRVSEELVDLGPTEGIELVRDRRSKDPATTEAAEVYRSCLADGLMFSVRGRFKNVLRFVPPFTTTDQELDRATEILEDGIRKALGMKA